MIAFHLDNESKFSYKWVEYCKKNNIDYKIVDCLSPTLFHDIHDCVGLMWHWHHANPSYNVAAKKILTVVENILDIAVFPDFNMGWHFDDKIAQLLIFDGAGIAIPDYWLFFDQKKALEWAKTAKYPLVFKLKRGAGSANVKLIRSRKEAKKIIKRMFGNGICPVSLNLRDNVKKRGKKQIMSLIRLKGIKKTLKIVRNINSFPNEKGYVLFQEFIPNCECDYRVIVIGDKVYAFKRYVRNGDFRASGSGKFSLDPYEIDPEMIKIAMKVSNELDLKCMAFDFLKSHERFLLIEMSYGFIPWNWNYYWDSNLELHQEIVDPITLIIENFFKQIDSRKKYNSNRF